MYVFFLWPSYRLAQDFKVKFHVFVTKKHTQTIKKKQFAYCLWPQILKYDIFVAEATAALQDDSVYTNSILIDLCSLKQL